MFQRDLTLTIGLLTLRLGTRKTLALRTVNTAGSVIASGKTAPSALIPGVVPFFCRCFFFFGSHRTPVSIIAVSYRFIAGLVNLPFVS